MSEKPMSPMIFSSSSRKTLSVLFDATPFQTESSRKVEKFAVSHCRASSTAREFLINGMM